MITVSQEQLSSIANAIEKVSNPHLVILFGSQARGNANQNSDIDLLVIGDPPSTGTWSRRREIGRIRRSLPNTKLPVDILFFTPEEVRKWRRTTNHIISEAFQEGKIIYERP
jgi:predicted nucleotidyltransferase